MSNVPAVADDEMPLAPAVANGDDTVANEMNISGEMDADIVATGVEGGDPLPPGTYHFKLVSYEKVGKPNDDGQGADPYFAITYECQDPRFPKRKTFDNVTWVRPFDLAGARAGDPAAQEKCKKRLGKIKALQTACGFKPSGKYDVMADFLDKQPEVKIQLSVKERMQKDANNKYTVKTGIMDNNVVKYFPVMRTA